MPFEIYFFPEKASWNLFFPEEGLLKFIFSRTCNFKIFFLDFLRPHPQIINGRPLRHGEAKCFSKGYNWQILILWHEEEMLFNIFQWVNKHYRREHKNYRSSYLIVWLLLQKSGDHTSIWQLPRGMVTRSLNLPMVKLSDSWKMKYHVICNYWWQCITWNSTFFFLIEKKKCKKRGVAIVTWADYFWYMRPKNVHGQILSLSDHHPLINIL